MELTKVCNMCKIDKKASDFHKNGDKLYPTCKICRSNKMKAIKYPKPTEGTKLCNSCNTVYDVSNFHGDTSQSSGLQSACIKCQREKTQKCTSTLDGFIKKIYNGIHHNCERRAKKLNIEITIEDIHELYKKQNGLCAISKLKMTHITYKDTNNKDYSNRMNISIDRIDSNLGYTKDNIQLVGAIINKMKTDVPDIDFINMCSIIANYNKK